MIVQKFNYFKNACTLNRVLSEGGNKICMAKTKTDQNVKEGMCNQPGRRGKTKGMMKSTYN
jgi:hypothetical protein